MGYMCHHALVVSCFREMRDVHQRAQETFAIGQVSPVCQSPVNGYVSFAVFPDGSKEGWLVSDRANQQRASFVAYLRSLAYEDGSSSYSFVEFSYGDEDGPAFILNEG